MMQTDEITHISDSLKKDKVVVLKRLPLGDVSLSDLQQCLFIGFTWLNLYTE